MKEYENKKKYELQTLESQCEFKLAQNETKCNERIAKSEKNLLDLKDQQSKEIKKMEKKMQE